MPGATPLLALPYPLNADPVHVPTDLQTLATRLEAVGAGIAPFTTAARNALAGADRWVGRIIYNTTTSRLERWDGAAWKATSALDDQGTFAARPAAGVQGRYYFATDNGILYRDTGAAWTSINDHGGLVGLADDDHPQYHTDARGDARYPRLTILTADGDLPVRAGGTWTRLPIGTPGQAVVVNPAGTGLAYGDAGFDFAQLLAFGG